MNLTLIASLAASIAGFGLAWQLQAGNISELKLETANERIATARATRQTLERVTGQNATAQANATASGIRLRADVASATSVGNGLRVTTSSAVRTAAQDPSVCSDTAATLGELLDSVSAERRELAEKAQRHTIDIQALMERQQ